MSMTPILCTDHSNYPQMYNNASQHFGDSFTPLGISLLEFWNNQAAFCRQLVWIQRCFTCVRDNLKQRVVLQWLEQKPRESVWRRESSYFHWATTLTQTTASFSRNRPIHLNALCTCKCTFIALDQLKGPRAVLLKDGHHWPGSKFNR